MTEKIFKTHPNKNNVLFKNVKCLFSDADRYTVKLGIKELLNKKQTGFKELFTDFQPFNDINLTHFKDSNFLFLVTIFTVQCLKIHFA